MEPGKKSIYILQQWPEMVTADPIVLERLQRFVDWQLSLEGEMTKALEAERLLGKHVEEKEEEL